MHSDNISRALLCLTTAAAILGGCTPQTEQTMNEDHIAFTNAVILTSADAEPLRGATLVTEGGKIAWVGRGDDAPLEGARVIDVEGSMILPGLVDAHAHLEGLGEALEHVDLVGTESYEEVIDRLSEMAERIPEGEWVRGRGWDQNDWEETSFPTRGPLDEAIPDHPVAISRIDGHALLVNTRALELAGVDAETEAPAGGAIIRDESGEPTGVLVDNAMGLVSDVIPSYTRADRKRQLASATKEAASKGLTGVHDAGVSQQTIDILLELAEEGDLPIRVYAMLSDEPELIERWYERGPLFDSGDGRVTVRAIKLYADGALGSRGAALHEPYSDAPEETGLLLTPPEHLREVSRSAREHGFQVGTHAIGDRGSTIVIEAYENAGVEPEDRYRIEHLQTVRLSDLPRIREMGVIASMQPTHATSDMDWADERLGETRLERGYVWKSVLETGIPLAFGSDFPVEEVRPFYGLYSAVTRQDLEGEPEGGWTPKEKVSIREAIAAFTSGAAYAEFAEDRRGRLEPGMDADFIVVDRNLLEVGPAEILDTTVLYTVSGGRIVYE